MAPKRGQKRKAAGSVDAPANTTANGDTTQIAPPNVETWPGWVEMESEPVSDPTFSFAREHCSNSSLRRRFSTACSRTQAFKA